ncbi:MAG: hypothetical protein J6T70_08390 [Bacteroidales bacterium]|nr:hypothetical protein [Bacteroidales bacterium]
MKRILLFFTIIIDSILSFGQSASIEQIWIVPNVNEYNQYGLLIHVKFNVNGLYKQDGKIVAYFYDANKNKRYTNDAYYKTGDNQLCCSGNFRPKYQSAAYNDYVLFIPIEVLTNGLPNDQSNWLNYFRISIFSKHSNTYTHLMSSELIPIELLRCGNGIICICDYYDWYEYSYNVAKVDVFGKKPEDVLSDYENTPKNVKVNLNFTTGYCKITDGNNTWIRRIESFGYDTDKNIKFYMVYLSKDKRDFLQINDNEKGLYYHTFYLNNKSYILLVNTTDRDNYLISGNIIQKVKEKL